MAVMDNADATLVTVNGGPRAVMAGGRRVRDLPATPAELPSEEPHSAPGGRRGADGSGA